MIIPGSPTEEEEQELKELAEADKYKESLEYKIKKILYT